MTANDPPPLSSEEAVSVHRLRDVEKLTRDELDDLPFGVIQVDRDGVILAYNAAEAKLADLRPEDVIGKNFFTHVAPCTNNEDFGERFRKGIARGKMHETFPFRFEFSKSPVHVMISLHYEGADEHAWIFVDENPNA